MSYHKKKLKYKLIIKVLCTVYSPIESAHSLQFQSAKNQMLITIACRFYSRSWAGF